MEAALKVDSIDLNELVEFSSERRVRKKLVQTDIIVSEIVCYEPGQMTKMHHHPHQDEFFYCVEGGGVVTFADQDDIPIAKGGVVLIPSGTAHGVTTSDTRLVLMFTKGPGIPNPRRDKAVAG